MHISGAIDSTGRVDLASALDTLRSVAARYRELGVEPQRPVMLIVEDLPIMGATESRAVGHRLHVGRHVVDSGMLDGLMAHEMGHMVRTEQGHASHSPDAQRRAVRSLAVARAQRKGFFAAARVAVNHVQDVYADDLAIPVIGRDRIGPFFSDWVRRASVSGGDRWTTVGHEAAVAFALGNMARHGVSPEDGASRHAESFARSARLPFLAPLAAAFRDLPATGDTRTIDTAMRGVLDLILAEGLAR